MIVCLLLFVVCVGVCECGLQEREPRGETIGQVNSNYDSVKDLLLLIGVLLVTNTMVRALAPWVVVHEKDQEDR